MRTIEEKNRMIAEFMGFKPENEVVNFGAKSVIAYQIEPKRTDGFTNLTYDFMLKYHKSWDWLMPVVEEIYNTGLDEQNTNEIGDVTHALLDVDINALHNAVVEFIEMYNQKNK